MNKNYLTEQVFAYIKIAKICPIFEFGDKNEMTNYRQISVTFPKILEKLIYTKLISLLLVNNIINPSQQGFRTHHNTKTAIIDLLNFVTDKVTENMNTVAIYRYI